MLRYRDRLSNLQVGDQWNTALWWIVVHICFNCLVDKYLRWTSIHFTITIAQYFKRSGNRTEARHPMYNQIVQINGCIFFDFLTYRYDGFWKLALESFIWNHTFRLTKVRICTSKSGRNGIRNWYLFSDGTEGFFGNIVKSIVQSTKTLEKRDFFGWIAT